MFRPNLEASIVLWPGHGTNGARYTSRKHGNDTWNDDYRNPRSRKWLDGEGEECG